MKTRRTRRSHAAWAKDIEEQIASGNSVNAFSLDRGLPVHSFRYHKSRVLRQEQPATGFAEVASSRGMVSHCCPPIKN